MLRGLVQLVPIIFERAQSSHLAVQDPQNKEKR